MGFFSKKLRKEIKSYMTRPLDIGEILCRETDKNVVIDAYEYFMRQSDWEIDGRFGRKVEVFLLCVLYDGEVGNGGVSQFLANSSGDRALQTAEALHEVGAISSENILRKSFSLFPGGVIPMDREERNRLMDEMQGDDLDRLDMDAYEEDILSHCYQYLMANREAFLP